MSFEFNIKGLKEIEQALIRAGQGLKGAKAINTSLRKATEPIHKAILNRVPTDDGILKQAIKRRKKKDSQQIVVTRGKNVKYDAFYWKFVEFGFTHTNGTFVPGTNFIRISIQQNLNASANIFVDDWSARAKRILKRANLQVKGNKLKRTGSFKGV